MSVAPPLSPDIARSLAAPDVRVEGREKVTGGARYAGDIILPGQLWAKFTRSPYPHARIVSIDTAAAKAVPGVHAVLTGEDVRGAYFGRRLMDWPVLVWDRVRFIGDRVAAVAAETEEAAEEAAALVEVEHEELPGVFTFEDAMAESAPILHPEWESYRFLGKRPPVPHPNLQGYQLITKGEPDIDKVFASAHRVFEHTFYAPRMHQGFIEPHATMVWIDQQGKVRVHSTNKVPFTLRDHLANTTGLPKEQIVVHSGYIGGDFGGKGLSPDEFPAYYLAKATGRPIKCVMTYTDELQTGNPRHEITYKLKTAVDINNRFLAHQVEARTNGGAYGAAKVQPQMTVGALCTLAAYEVPHARMEQFAYYSNSMPCGHMRAPGEPQGVFAGEAHVDMIARELGVDPLEFRLLNTLRAGETNPRSEKVREARGAELLEALRRDTGWGKTQLPPNVGRGIALSMRHVTGGKTEIDFKLLPDGRVEALTGMVEQGGGAHTVINRTAAVTLGVDPSNVVVRYGNTEEAKPDPGAGGGRVTHVVGRTAINGATVLKERLEELASEVLGWPAGQVKLENGVFTDGAGSSKPFLEVTTQIARGGEVNVTGLYDSEAEHEPGGPSDYNFGCYVAEVEVDPETGVVDIRQITLAADVGTIINPIGHQGQLDGGFVTGLGSAMMEELTVEDGKVTVPNLGDYKLPTTMDVPPFRTLLVPTTVGPGPFGAKMAGELTNVGVPPAIRNAIQDAIGAKVNAMPFTPERVLDALRNNS